MSVLTVERLGGLAGFGGAGSHIRSEGRIELASLSDEDQRAVAQLFRHADAPRKASPVRDGFHYRVTRTVASRAETVEIPEAAMPAALIACVRDELI